MCALHLSEDTLVLGGLGDAGLALLGVLDLVATNESAGLLELRRALRFVEKVRVDVAGVISLLVEQLCRGAVLHPCAPLDRLPILDIERFRASAEEGLGGGDVDLLESSCITATCDDVLGGKVHGD